MNGSSHHLATQPMPPAMPWHRCILHMPLPADAMSTAGWAAARCPPDVESLTFLTALQLIAIPGNTPVPPHKAHARAALPVALQCVHAGHAQGPMWATPQQSCICGAPSPLPAADSCCSAHCPHEAAHGTCAPGRNATSLPLTPLILRQQVAAAGGATATQPTTKGPGMGTPRRA
jgi:hypothetical protein